MIQLFWHWHFASLSGSDFQCNTHIIPVKNEEGVVMMFILNFDYVVDEGSDNSAEKISPTSPTKSDQSECFMYHYINALHKMTFSFHTNI